MTTTEGEASPARPTRAGVIDIGSNSIRLVIGERQGEKLRVLESLRTPVPVGQEVFRTNIVSPAVVSQVLATLERYRQTLAEYDVRTLRTVARPPFVRRVTGTSYSTLCSARAGSKSRY